MTAIVRLTTSATTPAVVGTGTVTVKFAGRRRVALAEGIVAS